MGPADLPRARRIQAHVTALARLIQQDPEAVQGICDVLNEERPMTTSTNLVKLPSDLVQRAQAQWEVLMQIPEFRAAAPRRSGAAAVRMLLQLKLDELEADAPRSRRRERHQ